MLSENNLICLLCFFHYFSSWKSSKWPMAHGVFYLLSSLFNARAFVVVGVEADLCWGNEPQIINRGEKIDITTNCLWDLQRKKPLKFTVIKVSCKCLYKVVGWLAFQSDLCLWQQLLHFKTRPCLEAPDFHEFSSIIIQGLLGFKYSPSLALWPFSEVIYKTWMGSSLRFKWLHSVIQTLLPWNSSRLHADISSGAAQVNSIRRKRLHRSSLLSTT